MDSAKQANSDRKSVRSQVVETWAQVHLLTGQKKHVMVQNKTYVCARKAQISIQLKTDVSSGSQSYVQSW